MRQLALQVPASPSLAAELRRIFKGITCQAQMHESKGDALDWTPILCRSTAEKPWAIQSLNSFDSHVFSKEKKIHKSKVKIFKGNMCYLVKNRHFLSEEMPLRVHLYGVTDSWPWYRCTVMCRPLNKQRQLVEVHRVTTLSCKMCHDHFD